MRKLSLPQRQALRDARDHGSATYRLSGRSEWGGWTWTARKLRQERWLDSNNGITEIGRWRIAIDLGEIPKDTPPPENPTDAASPEAAEGPTP